MIKSKKGKKPWFKKPSPKVSERMKRIRSVGTRLEVAMEKLLKRQKIRFERQPILKGRPDFRVKGTNVLIFCDSSFWHGRRENELNGEAFKKNKDFWVNKLAGNRKRDARINRALKKEGWRVLRFWDTDIFKFPEKVTKGLLKEIEKMEVKKPTAIDLFCGAGGLTLGLKRAGFEVVAGVELNAEIAKTYEANHRKTRLLIKNVREVTGKEIFKLTGKKEIDLVAGCPPCQGFSQLTEKYKRQDSRNDLVLEMARLIEEIKPKMVMMENVPGIATKGKSILDHFTKKLTSMGYLINMRVLQMADYGVPQSRRRFVLLAGRGFEVPLPSPTHSRKGDIKKKLKPWMTISEIIKNLQKPVKLSFALKNGEPEKFNWHVIRDLQEISIKRLKAIKEGDNRLALPKELRPKCHKNKKAGFHNVYGRLRWDNASSTITSGCTTPCMGRFGHPDEDRTISIKEAALIQTFPISYKFKTKFMDTACDLVGNALPCRFAAIASKVCFDSWNNIKGVRT